MICFWHPYEVSGMRGVSLRQRQLVPSCPAAQGGDLRRNDQVFRLALGPAVHCQTRRKHVDRFLSRTGPRPMLSGSLQQRQVRVDIDGVTKVKVGLGATGHDPAALSASVLAISGGMEDPLQGKDTADGLALEERLNSRDIPQVCLDALETVGVVDAECGRGGNIGGDEFEGRVELQQQLGELLSDKTWRLSAASCVTEQQLATYRLHR